eukprot:TRINITY_DN459_c0_g2_i2.p1 TRINITY_DN459_c0_g2~~TRINITY_DN459_c0_g2_i2.p1  ORF type:complete len:530 (-),score=153.19 TRINITY_DN459_c0_g2_i2:10-1476(-)
MGAQKTVAQPAKKMRAFHWNKLRGPQINTTLFKDLQADAIDLDTTLLENMFCQPEKKAEDSADKAPKKPVAPPKVTHVNGKTLQAVGIYVKQLTNNKEFKDIMISTNKDVGVLVREAVLSLDLEILNFDKISMLIGGVTDQSELDAIKAWAANPENNLDTLNEVDKYFLHTTLALPHFIERLKCWKAVLSFEEANNANMQEIILMQKGLRCLRSSKQFKKVLEILIHIGNFMNFGTRTGNTVGFELESLEKVAETRANVSGKGTLMDFLVAQCDKHYPNALDLTSELANLEVAAKASFDKIDMGIKEVVMQLKEANSMASSIKPVGPQDKFQQVLDQLAKYDMDAKDTQMVWEDVQKDWEEVAKMFAKDTSKVKPEAFFVQVNTFVGQFKEARQKAIQKAEEEAKKAADKGSVAAKKSDLAQKKAELEARKEALRKKKEQDESAAKSLLNDVGLDTDDLSTHSSGKITKRRDSRGPTKSRVTHSTGGQ